MIRLIKKAVKYIILVLVIMLALIALYLITAFVLSFLGTNPQKPTCEEKMKLYVFSNGVHTDIAISVENLPPILYEKLNMPSGIKIISFGWGDKEFYINTPEWKDLTVKTAFRALFLKSESAMHVTYYPNTDNSWNLLQLCPQQMDSLVIYIEKSFVENENGEFILIDVPGYSVYDAFFESRGSFSLFKTCNVWTGNALKTAQIKTSVWSPFDYGILYHTKKG